MAAYALACAVVLAAAGGRAGAQTGALVQIGQARTASGLVQHPGADSTPVPAAHQLVVLHRVGQDHAGPLDSTYTDARGAYRFSYKTSGSPDAVYFASANYDGIAYFTSPFQTASVVSPDGDIMVFDTTSSGLALKLDGRHFVVSEPNASGVRQIAEVFDIGNEGVKTLVARDSLTPLWTAALSAGATSPTVSGGDIAAGAVDFTGGRVRVFAPVSPGLRQLAVSFNLPASAFPLSLPMGDGVGVLELLLEEESATPVMPGLAQQSSVSSQGRTFKRYLAQDVPPGAVLRINAAGGGSGTRTRFISGIVFVMALAMAAALAATALRPRRSGEESTSA